MKKIHLLTIYLSDAHGCTEHHAEYNCEEKGSTYIVDCPSNFGGKTTRVKKAQLGQPSSAIRENLYYAISYTVWCLTEDINRARRDLRAVARAQASIQSKAASSMLSALEEHLAALKRSGG